MHVVEEELLKLLVEYVSSTECSCLLLSGGIDTTLVALAARLAGLRPLAITSYYAGGLPRDLPYAIYAARVLGLDHIVVGFDDSYVRSRARLVVSCTGRDDYVEVRNDVVMLRALEEAVKRRCSCVYLGEAGDELFLGYSYHRLLTTRELYGQVLAYARRGRYPGLELAECLGIEAHAPLLQDGVVELALHSIAYNAERGKDLARRILARYGLALVADRDKVPAEAGGGTDVLGYEALRSLTGLDLSEKHG
jgi:asparagine synthase (glutamine-hydrolysing)